MWPILVAFCYLAAVPLLGGVAYNCWCFYYEPTPEDLFAVLINLFANLCIGASMTVFFCSMYVFYAYDRLRNGKEHADRGAKEIARFIYLRARQNNTIHAIPEPMAGIIRSYAAMD